MLNTLLTLEELSSSNVKYYFLWDSQLTERTNYGYHAMLSWSLFDMQNDEKWGNAATVQRVTSGPKGDLTAGAAQKLSSKNSESLLAESQEGHQEVGTACAKWKQGVAWWNAAWSELGKGCVQQRQQLRKSGHGFHPSVFNRCIINNGVADDWPSEVFPIAKCSMSS